MTVFCCSVIFQIMGNRFGKIGELMQRGLKKLKKEKQVQAEPAENVKAPRLSEEAYSLLCSLFEDLGPRPAATAASRNAARRIGEVFGSFSDDVTVTTGRIVPAIGKWMLLSAIIASTLIFIFISIGLPLVASVVGALFTVSTINELRVRKNPLRSVFPSGEAANVHAVIEPEGVAERTLILSAHHDTAAVSRTEKEGILSRLSAKTGAVSFLILAVLSIFQLVLELIQGRLFGVGFPGWIVFFLSFFSSAFAVLSFYLAFASSLSAYTSGAGDNLSGVAVVATLGRYYAELSRQGKGLASTRLVFVSFDGEECGAEGSAIWYRDNSHILVNPINVNFDGLYDADTLAFLSSDGNGFVPLSSSLASRCSLLAISMGYKVQTGKLGFLGGATDAVSASMAGVEATTLTSMASGIETPAHTEDDTPDKVSQEALSIAMAVTIKLVEELDRKEAVEEKAGLLEDGKKYRLSRY